MNRILTNFKTDNNATGHLRTRISFDDETGTLFVTVIAARDLRARCHIRSGYPNPFVKIYLLPPRRSAELLFTVKLNYSKKIELVFRVENKRRTKFIQSTCNPEWNQTVVYKDLNRSHLFSSYLEFTVWDYDRFESNEFLGQVVLSLSGTVQKITSFVTTCTTVLFQTLQCCVVEQDGTRCNHVFSLNNIILTVIITTSHLLFGSRQLFPFGRTVTRFKTVHTYKVHSLLQSGPGHNFNCCLVFRRNELMYDDLLLQIQST